MSLNLVLGNLLSWWQPIAHLIPLLLKELLAIYF